MRRREFHAPYRLAQFTARCQVGMVSHDAVATQERLPALVLCPTRLSASLAHPLYQEQIQGRPFLAWWVDRLVLRLPRVRLHVLCYTNEDESRIARILSGAASIIRVEGGSRLACFGAAAAVVRSADVAFIQEGFAFAPPDLLPRVYAHHVEHGNPYTRVSGLPPGTVPEVYQSRFLLDLLRRRHLEQGREPSVHIARWTIKVIRRARPEAWRRTVVFDAARAYGVDPLDLPERLLLEMRRDFEIARSVAASVPVDDSPLRELRLWRFHTIALQREARDARRAGLGASLSAKAMAKPANVLFVSNPSAYTGAEASWCELIARLDPARFKASALIGREGLLTERLRALGVHVISPGHGFEGEHFEEDLACVLSAIGRCAPHLLHFNAPSGAPALYAASLLNIPVITHCRVASFGFHRELLRASDVVIAVSEYVKRLVLRLDIPEDRVQVVYNAVDVATFRPGVVSRCAARAHLGLPAGTMIVAAIARYAPNKRHDLLLRAVARAKQRIPALHLVLNGEIGESAETYDAVVNQIRTLGMADWVTMIPFVQDVRYIHAAADLLVLCSESEPLGRCVIEAMAMELPAIIVDSGGLTELVRNGETGFVVPRDNPALLAQQIERVLTDRELAARVGAAARACVASRLDPDRLAAQVMNVYDEVVGRPAFRKPRGSGSMRNIRAEADGDGKRRRLEGCQE